jgi:hypothetical protein
MQLCDASAVLLLIAGVGLQSWQGRPGHVGVVHAARDETARGNVWVELVRRSRCVRNPIDAQAVSFSRNSGNHPAIRASLCHGFVWLSGGA